MEIQKIRYRISKAIRQGGKRSEYHFISPCSRLMKASRTTTRYLMLSLVTALQKGRDLQGLASMAHHDDGHVAVMPDDH
jgi:hypothetical protein